MDEFTNYYDDTSSEIHLRNSNSFGESHVKILDTFLMNPPKNVLATLVPSNPHIRIVSLGI